MTLAVWEVKAQVNAASFWKAPSLTDNQEPPGQRLGQPWSCSEVNENRHRSRVTQRTGHSTESATAV